jgi:hypothetical protein
MIDAGVIYHFIDSVVRCVLCASNWVSMQAGIPLNPCSMVLSLGILALPVRFGVCSDAKMLPSFLRCFPNLETLHILVS